QPRQVQPAAARCRFQASRSSCRSCSRPGPPAPRRPANSPVRLASSQSRTSARNSSSCAVKRTRASSCSPLVRRLNLPSTCLLGRGDDGADSGGAVDPVESEALTIPAAVARAAREFGDAEALAVPYGMRLSYRELAGQVEGVSAALIAAGIEAGERVALWAPSGAEWMLAALGALSAGAALVPVSTRFTGPEALDVIVRGGARALFVAGNFLGVDRLGALRAAAAARDAAAEDAAAGDAAARDTAAEDAAAGDAGADTGMPPGRALDRLALVVRVP